ncbi:unnamed protein product [Hymenolepis diminuta]|uniref:RT_RNaseH_2 domain-containing protein n=1 Tax=Hymenolepis diminuta TaxID=6216 RepID=A0A564ZA15_HYMDI|nr:unnamed protein product [Hymenolepis diminuta]
MADLPHATRIIMLLREFNKSDNHLCSVYFQSMDPADLTCEKMISKFGSAVGDRSSLFNLTASEDENVLYHLGIVNRLRISFSSGSLEENQFRCLIFILSLRSPCHAEIRLTLLSLLDKKPDVKKSCRKPESAEGLLIKSVYEEAFKKLRSTLNSGLPLIHYDPSSSMVLSADAFG